MITTPYTTPTVSNNQISSVKAENQCNKQKNEWFGSSCLFALYADLISARVPGVYITSRITYGLHRCVTAAHSRQNEIELPTTLRCAYLNHYSPATLCC